MPKVSDMSDPDIVFMVDTACFVESNIQVYAFFSVFNISDSGVQFFRPWAEFRPVGGWTPVITNITLVVIIIVYLSG